MSTFDSSIPSSGAPRNYAPKFFSAAFYLISFSRRVVGLSLATLGLAHAAQLEVTWTDNSADEVGFKVERSIDNGVFSQIATVGANVTSYIDTNLSAGAYSYRIRAYSSAADSDYSSASTPFVIAATVAPSISSQPSSQTVLSGTNVSLVVIASGSPSPTFQWSKNGSAIAGATAATLIFANVGTGDAGSYFVTATNTAGAVQSATAIITVTNPVVTSAPAFIVQPSSQTVTAGSNLTLSASVSGAPSPSIQWQKDGVAISGATNATLSLTNVTSAMAGSYRVIASNSAGTTTSATATLTVNAVVITSAPVFLSQPLSQAASVGAAITLSALATSTPSPSYQWQKDGIAISGATNATLSLPNITAAMAGSYQVVASNNVGTATSSAALLTVNAVAITSAPVFVTQPSSQTVSAGAGISLTALATSNPSPTYQWQKDGVAIAGATNATLSLTNITSSMSGSYQVIASNSVGTVTSSAALLTVSVTTITSAPVFTTQPLSQTVSSGSTISLTASATGSPTPTYQWQKDGVAITGATSPTLSLVGVTSTVSGSYRVLASNSVGSATSATAVISVSSTNTASAPVFVSQPVSQMVTPGTTVSLVAIAAASPAPTYQWKKNGATIASQTASTLTLTADSSTSGSYSVVASNSVGSVTSAVAQVGISASTPVSSSRLINASIRANAGQGADTLIVGFVTNGAQKSVLLRGIGPGLAPYTNAATFADPLLTLYSGKTALMANDNWSDVPTLQSVFTQVGAFALPSPSKDAALMANLSPNAYTAQITGNGSGMALVEVYDTDASSAAGRIVNIAARAAVNSSDNVVIVGFVVQGSIPKQVLIRGIGPSLAPLGVTGALAAAHLELFQGSALLQENSSWGGTAQLVSAFAQVGAFPLSNAASKDAAILATLNPGTYTVILSGSNASAGVALIELYEMP